MSPGKFEGIQDRHRKMVEDLYNETPDEEYGQADRQGWLGIYRLTDEDMNRYKTNFAIVAIVEDSQGFVEYGFYDRVFGDPSDRRAVESDYGYIFDDDADWNDDDRPPRQHGDDRRGGAFIR